MKKNVITIEVSEFWNLTMKLRYVEKIIKIDEHTCKKGLFLQQMSISNLGNEKWNDIQIENDVNDN